MKTTDEIMGLVAHYGNLLLLANPPKPDKSTAGFIAAMQEKFDEIRAALTGRMGWQGIDSAPRDRRILVWTGMNQYVAQWVQNPMTGHVGWLIGDNGNGEQLIVAATLWKPLPPPPAEGEK